MFFKSNFAKYHSDCVSEHNEQKLKRAIKRKEKATQSGSKDINNKRVTRSDADDKHSLEDIRCLFCKQTDLSENMCAAGTRYAKSDKVDREHVDLFTDLIREKALKLNDTHVLALLSTGDLISNEVYYHSKCLKAFNYRYKSSLENDTKLPLDARRDFLEKLHFEKIVSFVNESHLLNGEVSFAVVELERMYTDLLDADGIYFSRHTSRFTERLKSSLPGFTVQIVNRKNTLICLDVVDNFVKDGIHQINHSSLARALIKAVVPIRAQMSEFDNVFNGKFAPNCQQSSVPFSLVSLCSLLIDGVNPSPQDVSQAALTAAQLIMYSYKKRRNPKKMLQQDEHPKNQRHLKIRETPVPVYIGLNLMTIRAKTIIQNLHSLGISISYFRCRQILNNIASTLLEKFDENGVFLGNSVSNQFTIIAKDNIDVNAKSTKVQSHYHGISFTLMQFLENCDLSQSHEPLYDLSKETHRKLQLPECYSSFMELPFKRVGPLFYPVTTHNIDEM